jgi:hypothetical protein
VAETGASESGAPPRVLIVVAAVLAVALAVVVAVFGILANSGEDQPPPGPLPLVPVSAPQAGSPDCARTLAAVPAELTSSGAKLARRALAEPAPSATAAWGAPEPVVLRCGLDRPPELTPTAQLRVIDGVQWLVIPGEGASTWYVVDRPVYLALTVPAIAGTGPLQEISDVVAAKLQARPLQFG